MRSILIFVAVVVGLFVVVPVVVNLLVAFRGGLLGVGLCAGLILLIKILRRD
tara:strand:- start:962 stop:1117 length:156 start_codon:yes stop_codon:yes gene_type:complete